MLNLRILLIALVLCCAAELARATGDVRPETVRKETFIFAIEQNDTLRMDKYTLDQPAEAPQPVILFAFGGGFRGGNRAAASYVPFFQELARQGYIVVSTDYRTTLASLDQSPASHPQAFIGLLQEAIATATADFYRATRFVVEHSREWHADPDKIVACGSSAGAITVLQAEYLQCQGHPASRTLLPDGFHYAGVISFAGAIAATGPLEWKQTPCPLLLFHGDADRIVPYEKAEAEGIALWGSYSICQTLDQNNSPHVFYSVNRAGHEIADLPMKQNLWEIRAFLSRLWEETPLRFRHIREQQDGTAAPVPRYTLHDYLEAY